VPTIFLTLKAVPYGLGSLPREQVDHDGWEQPTLEHWNVRQVSDPFLIWFSGIKFSLELVLVNRVRVIGVSGFLNDTFAFALETEFVHDASDSRTAARFVVFAWYTREHERRFCGLFCHA
jgi:hypothetical protein